MKQRTNIQIEHTTLEKLKKQRITKRETYDEILNRIMPKNPMDKKLDKIFIQQETRRKKREDKK